MFSTVHSTIAAMPPSSWVPPAHGGSGFTPPVALRIDALYSAAVRIGGGLFNAHVFKAESFSESNPIMLVKGTDTDGTEFEVEININEINPANASFAELFALDGFNRTLGKDTQTARAASRAMAINGLGDSPEFNGFTEFNFIEIFESLIQLQLNQRNWEGLRQTQQVLDMLMRLTG